MPSALIRHGLPAGPVSFCVLRDGPGRLVIDQTIQALFKERLRTSDLTTGDFA